MRRRLTLLGTLGLLVVSLGLPATAAAGSAYKYEVTANYCDGDEPHITVKMIKPAGYYPDRFKIIAQGQHRNIGSSRWSAEGSRTVFSKAVPFQYARYTWSKPIYWNPSDNQWHRISLKLQVISGGSVVAQSTVRSVSC
jgi:hypothetical protein